MSLLSGERKNQRRKDGERRAVETEKEYGTESEVKGL